MKQRRKAQRKQQDDMNDVTLYDGSVDDQAQEDAPPDDMSHLVALYPHAWAQLAGQSTAQADALYAMLNDTGALSVQQ